MMKMPSASKTAALAAKMRRSVVHSIEDVDAEYEEFEVAPKVSSHLKRSTANVSQFEYNKCKADKIPLTRVTTAQTQNYLKTISGQERKARRQGTYGDIIERADLGNSDLF